MYLPLKIIKVVPKMSFPPGPPIHLPGMPPVPPMLPPPYAVPPMGGMIPMTVGMMPAPMMAPVAMTMPAPIIPPHHKLSLKKVNTNNQNSTFIKKDNNTVSCRSYLNAADHPEALRGPPVTVFVGNITERAQDSLVRQILQRCGIVLNWKRVQGANGKLQAFGFCEYGDPESALRAIRLLHDWEIGGKKLVVKVDAKTKEKLDEYKAKMAAKHDTENKDGKEDDKEKEKDSAKEGEDKEEGETSDEPLDEMSKQRDEIIRAAIEGLLRAHEAELSRPIETKESTPPTTTQSSQEKSTPKINRNQDNSPKPKIDFEKLKKTELDEMDLEEDKKSLIHREIDKFRDTYKAKNLLI